MSAIEELRQGSECSPIRIRQMRRTHRERAGSQSAGIHSFADSQQRRGKERQGTVVLPDSWFAAERSRGCEARDLREIAFRFEKRVINARASRTCATGGTRCCCTG